MEIDRDQLIAYIQGEIEQAQLAGNDTKVQMWLGQLADLDEDIALLEDKPDAPVACRTCNPVDRCGDCGQPTEKGIAPKGKTNWYPHPDVTPPPPIQILLYPTKEVEPIE